MQDWGWGVRCERCKKILKLDVDGYASKCKSCQMIDELTKTMQIKSLLQAEGHMTDTKCQNCSEIEWHPYPEEKPEDNIECLVQIGSTERIAREYAIGKHYRDQWRDKNGYGFGHVEAFVKLLPHYTPPPKKKTVSVSRSVLSQALKKLIFVDSGELLMPDFIEIEVCDDAT